MLRRSMLALIGATMVAGAASLAHADGKEPIVIGLVMPYSGWFAAIDEGTIKGAELAVDDINAAGGVMGRPLKIVSYDMKSDPPLGADGAIDVISKGAKMIMVPTDFDFGGPGAFVAQSKGIPVFSGAADAKFGVSGIGNMAYSLSVASQVQGALMAEWAYAQGWKTAYLLLDNTINYTKSLCANFADRWKTLAGADGLLGQDTFLNNDPSIATQTTRILDLPKKPDVVFLCSYPPGGASALRQLRAAGVSQPVLAGEAMDGNFWLAMTPGLDKFYVANYASYVGDDPDSAVNAFFQRLQKKTGKAPDISYSVRGYSIVQAFARAVERAKSTDGAKVAAALDSFDKEPLLIGPTSFDKKLHIALTRPMTIMEVEHGALHAVERYAVKVSPPVQY